MRIGIITLFPQMFAALNAGIPRIAQEKGKLQLQFWDPRDYTQDNHQTVDDTPYGGGPGMVILAAPLLAAIKAARTELPQAKVIYLSPQGQRLNHSAVMSFTAMEEIILLCGRYEGIDARVIALAVDEEWSLGDYVLSGGELPAMVIIDAIARQLPEVLGDAASANEDSFATGLLDYPHYTRPAEVAGLKTPDVLLSGNHAAIKRWRLKQALGRTFLRRPDLLTKRSLNKEEQGLLAEFKQENVDVIKKH